MRSPAKVGTVGMEKRSQLEGDSGGGIDGLFPKWLQCSESSFWT